MTDSDFIIERHSIEQGRRAGAAQAEILIAEFARGPGVKNTREQFERAAEALFGGNKEEVDTLRGMGVSEADLAAYVSAIVDGFREAARKPSVGGKRVILHGVNVAKLMRLVAIADATWLPRLVPPAGG